MSLRPCSGCSRDRCATSMAWWWVTHRDRAAVLCAVGGPRAEAGLAGRGLPQDAPGPLISDSPQNPVGNRSPREEG